MRHLSVPRSAGSTRRHRASQLLNAVGLGCVLGAVPSADIAARRATGGGIDLRSSGRRNPGALNALVVTGPVRGCAAGIADMDKGTAVAMAGRRLADPGGAHVSGSVAAGGGVVSTRDSRDRERVVAHERYRVATAVGSSLGPGSVGARPHLPLPSSERA